MKVVVAAFNQESACPSKLREVLFKALAASHRDQQQLPPSLPWCPALSTGLIVIHSAWELICHDIGWDPATQYPQYLMNIDIWTILSNFHPSAAHTSVTFDRRGEELRAAVPIRYPATLSADWC